MESSPAQRRHVSPAVIVVATAAIAVSIVAGWFLTRPAPARPPTGPSPEATAYLGSLHLSDVTMKAAENLMRQQVVYIDGTIANSGPRTIMRIDVYCVFSGVDGSEVYRERVTVVNPGSGTPFGPAQTRSFELPFDNLPDSWNQALPRLVIAEIRFAGK